MSGPIKWKRLPAGYLSHDGAWWLERGARMSTGGTNAWLIHRRVGPDRIGRDGGTAYDEKTGDVLWRLHDDGYTESAPSNFQGDLYAHDFDAGSLAEAKYVASIS